MSPTASIISVMGQGRGSPSGFGLFSIIRVESTIRSTPEMIKHILAIFNTAHLTILSIVYDYDIMGLVYLQDLYVCRRGMRQGLQGPVMRLRRIQ
jgi:hypothetical protein